MCSLKTQEFATPARGVTSIKFEKCNPQSFAIPARGITLIKFRDYALRQHPYIVVIIKGYR